MMSSHWGQHDEDCYGCKLRTIRLSRGEHPISRKDRQWDRDMEAYSRLRQDDVQPPRIDGSAELERKGRDQIEIETGKILNDKQLKQYQSLYRNIPTP